MNDAGLFIGALGIVLNLIIMIIQGKTKGDINELKAHVYQNFATKSDLYHMVRKNESK